MRVIDRHGRWPRAAAMLVVPSWGTALAGRRALASDGVWVAALALPILFAHQSEEWVRPGGFLPFCNQRLRRGAALAAAAGIAFSAGLPLAMKARLRRG